MITKSQKRVLLVLMVLIMVALNADSNVLAPTLVLIESEFHVSDASIGFMSMLFTIVGAVVSLLWGYFADKTSRKKLFALSVAIGEIPCLLTAFAPNYTVFFILRILTGMGVGAAFPLVFSIAGDIFDEKERPVAIAVLTMAFSLGQIVGAGVGGLVAESLGWRLPFILVAAPNFILLPLFWFLVPEPQKGASEEATKALVDAGIVYPRTIHIADYFNLFKIRTNLYLFIQGLAGTVPWGAFMFLNKFLEEEKGLSILMATVVYLVFGLGMAAGTIIGGNIGSVIFKKSPKNLPIFCGITTLIGCASVIGIFWIDVPIALLSLAGFISASFCAMTGPNMRTMLLDVNAPEQRGAIFSIFNLTDSLGTGIGRWFAGIISVMIGLTLSLTISVLFWIFCGIILIASAPFFITDMESLHIKMKHAAAEMEQKR